MDIKARLKGISYDCIDGNYIVSFESKTDIRNSIEELKDKELSLKVKPYRKKRSLDANAYFWVIVGKIADKLNSDIYKIYIDLLKSYGVFTHIVVKKHVVEKIKSEWRYCEVQGEVLVNGSVGVQIMCFFGSSTYDTKEMSRLIDGAVYEAKELGIEVLSDEEIQRMKERWGV